MSKPVCLNDFRLVALTPIVMKCFEWLVMKHTKACLPPSALYQQSHYNHQRPSSSISLLFSLLPSGKRYRSLGARSSRMLESFYSTSCQNDQQTVPPPTTMHSQILNQHMKPNNWIVNVYVCTLQRIVCFITALLHFETGTCCYLLYVACFLIIYFYTFLMYVNT